MRWWGSALVFAACSSPAKPATQPPLARQCIAIAPRCDRSVDDEAVFELVRHRCWACHAVGGIAGHDFPDLAALRAAPVADMVGTCQMPPDGAPLAEPDRRMFVEWASCSKR